MRSDSFDDVYCKKPEMFGRPYKELQNYFNNSTIKGNLLDLGCGQGRDALFLASIGYNVTAVDVSKVGIQQMINKAKSLELKIDGIVSDIKNLEIEKKFNVILFDMILHGFGKSVQLKLLQKYSNLLNNGGIFCIIYPDDFQVEQFMDLLNSTTFDWKFLDEIVINDIPKIEDEIIDYTFKMMITQRII